VFSEHRQSKARDLDIGATVPITDNRGESGTVGRQLDRHRPNVCLRAHAIGHDPAVRDTADQRLDLGMIDAQDGKTVEGNVLDERLERRPLGIEIAVEIHVLAIKICDHGDGRRKLDERTVGFVGLDDHPVATAKPGVGPVRIDDPAVDDGRVITGRIEQRGHHRRGRGFSVRATDGDRPFQAHQFGQHLGAPNDGNESLPRRTHLGVVRLDRRGDDDDRHVGDV
jgi:hypothetical protein